MSMSIRARRFRFLARAGAALCASSAVATWFGLASASAATTLGPEKTAWYDNTGAQSVTGATTPSAARSGELEVSYAPASASEPQQTLPATPAVPGAPASPPAKAGGNTLGGTLAFAAVEYAVPLQSQGQSIDPASIQATLTLQLDPSSSANVSSGDLVACPTNSPLWTSGGDQDASAAPAYTCGSGQAVTGNASGNTVTFSLSSPEESSLEQGVFSIVVVPGTSPSGAFQAIIEPPTTDSFTVTNEALSSNTNVNLAGSPGSPATNSASPSASNFAVSPYSGPGAAPWRIGFARQPGWFDGSRDCPDHNGATGAKSTCFVRRARLEHSAHDCGRPAPGPRGLAGGGVLSPDA